MQSQRWAWTHTYAVPLFVCSLVAVILTGGALVGVLVSGLGERRGGEHCLVGQWRIVSQRQGSELGSVLGGTLDLVGQGPRFTFNADGTGHADYNPQTRYETTSR
jgi:hypothetical protein